MRRDRGGGAALPVSVATLLLGLAYYAYLQATPFPPDWARVVPFVWLLGAVVGLVLGLGALAAGPHRILGAISALLSLANIGLAAVYAFAALMGG